MTEQIVRAAAAHPPATAAPAQHVYGALLDQAARRGAEPFVQCGGAWRSPSDLVDGARRVAGALHSLGVAKGDRVALIIPNRDEMLDVFFGCMAIGAIEVPLNAWLKGEFLRYQLADCEATVLIADDAGLRSAAPLLDSTAIKHAVALDAVDDATHEVLAGSVRLESFSTVVAQDLVAPEVELTDADLAAIIYTSGTTGLPKGCMLSHRYFLTGPSALIERGWVRPGERLLTAWPLFHTSGQVVALMTALLSDGSVVVEPEFSASAFLSRARTERADVLLGVGFMGTAMLGQPPSPDDRDHQVRLSVWIPMAPSQQEQFEERFGIPVITEGFGQTECFPITMAPLEQERSRLALGPPASHVEVALVDALDRPVAVGEIGEIVIRPRQPNVMYSGYWHKPEATLEAWRNLWHHTGDLAQADEHGNLSFVDRKKDALRRRGENVSSLELEAAIGQHPSVAQVAVCAVPSPLGEDDVKASVVLMPEAELTPEGAFEFFKTTLPYYAIPRYVDVRDALPTNALGRIMKHVLRSEGVKPTTWDLEALGLQVAKAERRR